VVREAAGRLVIGLARGSPADWLAALLERVAPWRPGSLAALTYHRVDEPAARPDLLPTLLSATPASFAAQVAIIADRYRPVSLAEVVEAARQRTRLPERAVLVTFDDAYRDFATNAWPILRAAGVPATLFVATSFADDPRRRFWWDRLWHALRTTAREELALGSGRVLPLVGEADRVLASRELGARIKSLEHEPAMDEVGRLLGELGVREAPDGDPAVLGWAELRRLAAEGVTLAAHTRTHPLLDRVSTARAVKEIAGSREDLQREVGPAPAVLAYPAGAAGPAAVESARRAGIALAFTTRRGGNDVRHAHPLRLRRINVGVRTGRPLVRAQLVWASTVDARRRRSGSGAW